MRPESMMAVVLCCAPLSFGNVFDMPAGLTSLETVAVGEFQNSDSPYGTFDQGGNVWEWNETVLHGSYRGLRGGSFIAGDYDDSLRASYREYHTLDPTDGYCYVGFRVVQVPEPAAFLLLAFGGLVTMRWARCLRATTIPAVLLAFLLTMASTTSADVFGTGENQFTIDFVPISGATNPTSAYGTVNNDYRMGIYNITNAQWNKFTASLGVPVTGHDGGYSYSTYWTGTNVPTNSVSWFEAAQFVNWLNTCTGHQAAYKFTGTQGTSNYMFTTWNPAEAAGGTNLYRNKDAKYYLPTEDEWVKAAYWNGTTLQTYATKAGDTLHQGNGTNGGWNYYNNGYATNPYGPWAVGSGSQELNGTYDMMGNVWEWMESSWSDPNYGSGSPRVLRGGSFGSTDRDLASSYRYYTNPAIENYVIGFRVAAVPEPGSLFLLVVGTLLARRLKRRR